MKMYDLYEYLCIQITKNLPNRPLLVAIDGVDTSGKSILSEQLVKILTSRKYDVIRASIDGFHNSKEKRYRLGSKSPEGYYKDSFNYDALISELLKPLNQKGSLMYKTSVYDFKTETVKYQNPKIAKKNSILIMEGVFLLRPELYHFWDYRVFLHIDFEQVIERAKKRDYNLFGTEKEIEVRYRSKYIPGQQIYLRESEPYEKADIVIDNNDFYNPRIVDVNEEIDYLRKKVFNFT